MTCHRESSRSDLPLLSGAARQSSIASSSPQSRWTARVPPRSDLAQTLIEERLVDLLLICDYSYALLYGRTMRMHSVASIRRTPDSGSVHSCTRLGSFHTPRTRATMVTRDDLAVSFGILRTRFHQLIIMQLTFEHSTDLPLRMQSLHILLLREASGRLLVGLTHSRRS